MARVNAEEIERKVQSILLDSPAPPRKASFNLIANWIAQDPAVLFPVILLVSLSLTVTLMHFMSSEPVKPDPVLAVLDLCEFAVIFISSVIVLGYPILKTIKMRNSLINGELAKARIVHVYRRKEKMRLSVQHKERIGKLIPPSGLIVPMGLMSANTRSQVSGREISKREMKY